MLTKCAICSSLMSSHAYESHRYVHDSTDRSFMCESGCVKTFFTTADELEMHQKFMHVSLTKLDNKIERTNSPKITDEQSPSSDKPNWSNATMTSSPATHDCEICSQSIPTTHMTSHMWCHSPIWRPFQCKHGCIKTYFAYESDRAEHYQGVHNIDKERKSKYGKSYCKVCNKSIKNLNMNLHLRTHDKTEQPFECLRGCRHLYFETQVLLDSHTEERHKNGRLLPKRQNYPLSDDLLDLIKNATTATTTTCPVCDESMCCTTIGQHMTTHPQSDRRPFKCLHGCVDTFFTTENEFDVHCQEVHGICPETHWPSCRICGQTAIDRYVMKKHIEKHDPTNRPFKCVDGCVNLYFPTAYKLTVHRREAHNIGVKSKCKICGETRKMSDHMAEHSSEGRPFKCVDGCPELYFETSEKFKNHQWKHRIECDRLKELTSASATAAMGATTTTAAASQSSTVSAVKTESNPLCSISNTSIVKVEVEQEADTSPSKKRTRIQDHNSKNG